MTEEARSLRASQYLLFIFTDPIGVEMSSSTITPSSPVKVVFSRNLVVDVPPVVLGCFFGPVGVDQPLYVDHGVSQRVVHLLAKEYPASYWVGES